MLSCTVPRDYRLMAHIRKQDDSSDLRVQVVKGALPLIRATKGFDLDNDIYLWASITQRAYQTAEILGSLVGLSRNRIVPEYSFLDPRGLGALEGYT